jgi:hypothetical protein
MAKTKACLQINMAPLDIRYISQTLPHQLRMLGGQVDEIQFTLDTHHSGGTRYSTENHAEKLSELRRYLESVCKAVPEASVVEVDYSQSSISAVARAFTGGDFVPKKAWNGSPFHAYLYGVLRARNDYVFHIDSDMLFGGGSQRWVAEAIDLLDRNKNVLACYPLGGPPRQDGQLTKKTATWADGWLNGHTSYSSALQHFAYSYPDISTRMFILDRRRFVSGEFSIPLVRPKWLRMLKALIFHTSRYLAVQDSLFLLTLTLDRRRIMSPSPRAGLSGWRRALESFLIERSPYLALEDCLSILALTKGFRFIGFLGADGGLWSLHPPYRSERFYAELPNLIKRIESDDVPDDQRGDFLLNDSMLDWSDVRPATRLARLRARRA